VIQVGSHALRPPEPVPERTRVVIIGGGIMGLALAHNLAKLGCTDVAVLERGYLCAGASGRNGGGVRMQWSTPTNIELARRSIELMKQFAGEMGINVWLRQGGYLFLARTPEVAETLRSSAELHNKHGVKTQILSPGEGRDVVPQLTMKGVVLCAYHPDDGVIFPLALPVGVRPGGPEARGPGGDLHHGHRVRAVRWSRARGADRSGRIACETVVISAGAWSPEVASLAGVKLPNEPHRHEILSTEPLKPFLTPLVSVLDSGLYFSQSMRGEIVGGMGDPREPAGLNQGSSLRFLSRFSRALTEQIPRLGQIKVLRQWAGCYDVTPDNNPVLGRTPGLPNMLQMSGFVGHGFMMAPAVAERMAAWMVSDAQDELFTRFDLDRFRTGKLERETMIIG
jgi:sarcosine oxidase subunit beta